MKVPNETLPYVSLHCVSGMPESFDERMVECEN